MEELYEEIKLFRNRFRFIYYRFWPLMNLAQTIFKVLLFTLGMYMFLGAYTIGSNLITNEWLIYQSKEYCFSFQYPGRWQLSQYGDNGTHDREYWRLYLEESLTFGSDMSMNIYQQPLNTPNLETVAKWMASELDFEATSSMPYTIDQKPALLYDYDNKLSVFDVVRRIDIFIARPQDGLVISLYFPESKFDEKWSLAEDILATFEYDDCVQQ